MSILRIDQEVFWLDVSMDDVGAMAESHTLDHLVCEETQSFGLVTKNTLIVNKKLGVD